MATANAIVAAFCARIDMRAVKVTFSDGDSLVTSINGTDEEIRAYYLGNIFNLGAVEDRLVMATKVEFLPDAPCDTP